MPSRQPSPPAFQRKLYRLASESAHHHADLLNLQAAAEHGEAQTKAGESAEAGREAAGEAAEVRLTG